MVPVVARVLHAWRRYRRGIKARLPFVRRRVYLALMRRHDELLASLGQGFPLASAVAAEVVIPPRGQPGSELCLFVTHAALPELKAHVVEHVQHLLTAGFDVALIVNTDLAPAAIRVDSALAERLHALLIRRNVGFDFAAWAHGWTLCGCPTALDRLLWINDSVVGPLDSNAFAALVARLRATQVDVVGLTENTGPRYHLQSFFLAFGRRALRSAELQAVLRHMFALPTKAMVIDVYETRLTERLMAAGLTCEALFPALTNDPCSSDDTAYRWSSLIRMGFPFIKSSVLTRVVDSAEARALLPARFRHPAR